MILSSDLRNAFTDLQFNAENHLYFIDGKNYPSATRIVKKFYAPFDKTIAKYVAKSRGVSEEEILEEWAEAGRISIEQGNRVHDYAEQLAIFYSGLSKEIRAPQDFKELGVYQWYSDLDKDRYILLVTELPLYHKPSNPDVDGEAFFAGTADAIFYDKELGGLLIVDWKTNKTLFKMYKKKKMHAPFQDLDDHNYNHYQVQLSLYRKALEAAGFKVVGTKIVWTDKVPNSNYKSYIEYDTDYLGDELTTYFQGQKVNYEFST